MTRYNAPSKSSLGLRAITGFYPQPPQVNNSCLAPNPKLAPNPNSLFLRAFLWAAENRQQVCQK
jgi:hypothetical protein